MADLAALVRSLPEGTQRGLELRFVDEFTQSEIGRRISASQMCVNTRARCNPPAPRTNALAARM